MVGVFNSWEVPKKTVVNQHEGSNWGFSGQCYFKLRKYVQPHVCLPIKLTRYIYFYSQSSNYRQSFSLFMLFIIFMYMLGLLIVANKKHCVKYRHKNLFSNKYTISLCSLTDFYELLLWQRTPVPIYTRVYYFFEYSRPNCSVHLLLHISRIL